MSRIHAFLHKARVLLGGRRYARELEEEMRFHLELDAQQHAKDGASPSEARAAARRRFGNVTGHAEEARRMTGLTVLDGIRQDAAFAFRTLRRSPVYSLVAVATLALGIGATTSVFSMVSGVLLRPLPYHDDRSLLSLYERREDGGIRLASYPTFLDWRAQLAGSSGPFEDMAFVRGDVALMRGANGPERVTVGYVTPGFFALLGSAAAHGRVLTPAEERGEGGRVLVLSHATWQRRFGGDATIVGRLLELDGGARRVVGVMPPGYAYPEWAAFWAPIADIEATDPALARRSVHVDSRIVARLRPGVDSARAVAAMRVVQSRLAREHPAEQEGFERAELSPVRAEVVGRVRPTLLVLGAATALVLLLACANVANLSLVRAAARSRELALRGALGAGRGRLARQLLTESVVLAAAGGALGVAIASGAVALVRRAAVDRIPRTEELALDWRVLLFAAGVSLLAALLAGVAPAIGATRPARLAALRSGASGSVGSPREARLRGALVSAQLALALVLLVGAGLLVQSFRRMEAVPLGFEPAGIVAASIDPPQDRYGTAEQAASLYSRLLDALRTVPGVREVAIVNHLPLSGASAPTPVTVDGAPADRPREALYRTASEGYARALQLPIVQGRWFDAADMRAPAAAGFVVNEAAARLWWPGEHNIVGRRITVQRASQARPDFGQPLTGEIIGVTADVRAFGREVDVVPEVFVPYTLEVWPWITVVARTDAGARLIPLLRAAILSVDPALPVGGASLRGGFATGDSLLDRWSAQRRVATTVLGAFAAAALVLAALGMYGVIAYGVSQRTRELGVRLALGATPRRVMRMVLVEAVWLAIAGLVVGVAAAAALTRLIRSVLFETEPGDPATYAVTVLVLVVTTLAASLLPARRATRLDPTIAMRGE